MTKKRKKSEHVKVSLEKFTEIVNEQEQKGINKYDQPIDPLDHRYDWLQMAMEEQVDGFQYLMAEYRKRQMITSKIRSLLNYAPNEFTRMEILHWLDLMEGKNNGPKSPPR